MDHNCTYATDIYSIRFTQFSCFSFITYRSCRHLDGKHTIFGKLVGGLDTLTEMEKIEVDNKDRPIEDIRIENVHIFVDPFQEADEQLINDRAEEIEKQQKAVSDELKRKQRNQPLKVFRSGIGKYMNTGTGGSDQPSTSSSATTATTLAATKDESIIRKRKVDNKYGFGNFSAW